MRPCPDHDNVGCPMERINRVNGQGPKPCMIMLIGEAPGKSEDYKGKPFVGKSGSELDYLYLDRCAQLSRAAVYITNVFKCRTNDKDRDPTPREIAACSNLLWDEIAEVRPSYIGAIGRISTRFILGMPDAKMEKMHGFGYERVLENPMVMEPLECCIMPLYHPAFGLHNTSMMRHIMEDFTRFGRMVRGDQSVMWRERV